MNDLPVTAALVKDDGEGSCHRQGDPDRRAVRLRYQQGQPRAAQGLQRGAGKGQGERRVRRHLREVVRRRDVALARLLSRSSSRCGSSEGPRPPAATPGASTIGRRDAWGCTHTGKGTRRAATLRAGAAAGSDAAGRLGGSGVRAREREGHDQGRNRRCAHPLHLRGDARPGRADGLDHVHVPRGLRLGQGAHGGRHPRRPDAYPSDCRDLRGRARAHAWSSPQASPPVPRCGWRCSTS